MIYKCRMQLCIRRAGKVMNYRVRNNYSLTRQISVVDAVFSNHRLYNLITRCCHTWVNKLKAKPISCISWKMQFLYCRMGGGSRMLKMSDREAALDPLADDDVQLPFEGVTKQEATRVPSQSFQPFLPSVKQPNIGNLRDLTPSSQASAGDHRDILYTTQPRRLRLQTAGGLLIDGQPRFQTTNQPKEDPYHDFYSERQPDDERRNGEQRKETAGNSAKRAENVLDVNLNLDSRLANIQRALTPNSGDTSSSAIQSPSEILSDRTPGLLRLAEADTTDQREEVSLAGSSPPPSTTGDKSRHVDHLLQPTSLSDNGSSSISFSGI